MHRVCFVVQQFIGDVQSVSLAVLINTIRTKPELASTPMWASVPKYHWLSFLVWCISGLRCAASFLVEHSAAIEWWH
jgi:hypothetical protein